MSYINKKSENLPEKPLNISFYKFKITERIKERQRESQTRQNSEFKAAIDNGFNFLPLNEIQTTYSIISTQKQKRLFLVKHLDIYRKAYVYYLQYDETLVAYTKSVCDFLDLELSKIQSSIITKIEPEKILKNIPILEECMLAFDITDRNKRYLLADKGNTKQLGRIEALITAIRHNDNYHIGTTDDDEIRNALSELLNFELTRGKKTSKCYKEVKPQIEIFLKARQTK